LVLGHGQEGLVISRMCREPGNRWGFQALGTFCKGHTWKDSLPELRQVCQKSAREMQLR